MNLRNNLNFYALHTLAIAIETAWIAKKPTRYSFVLDCFLYHSFESYTDPALFRSSNAQY